ncbi:MAG: hypothetical protein MUO70_03920, partial [Euryarchaeota archaeon]|nr:hypothetical protein [Euryarchaeota archaeon]
SLTRAIFKGPALIVALSISGTAATPDAQIYDGVNLQGRELMDLRVVANDSFSPELGPGMECLTGIFVVVDAATTFLTISYYPAKEMSGAE